MSTFDKFCAAVGFFLGGVLLVFGVFGTFLGCRLWISLPPILGVLPAFAGWGIVRAVYIAWDTPPEEAEAVRQPTEFEPNFDDL